MFTLNSSTPVFEIGELAARLDEASRIVDWYLCDIPSQLGAMMRNAAEASAVAACTADKYTRLTTGAVPIQRMNDAEHFGLHQEVAEAKARVQAASKAIYENATQDELTGHWIDLLDLIDAELYLITDMLGYRS